MFGVILDRRASEMYFCAINLEAWFHVQTYIKYFTLDRPPHLFVCLWTHAAMSAICLLGSMCVPFGSQVSFAVQGIGLPSRAVWIQGNLPSSCFRSLIELQSLCVSLLHHKTWGDKLQDCQIKKVKQQFIHPLPSPSPWSFCHTFQHTHNICLL